MYGWRGKIGHIYPASGTTAEPERYKMLPSGVAIYTTRIRMRRATAEELAKLFGYVEDAAELLALARVDIIVFNCTLGSLIKGPGYDREIITKIEGRTGIPATTAATAVVEALERLEIKKAILVSPYTHEMNLCESRFLKNFGIEVINMKGLELVDPHQQAEVEPETWYRLVKETITDMADGVLVSCAGIRVVDIIDNMEMDFGKPVVTSNQAVLWDCLRRLKVRESIKGFGRLLREI